MSNVRPRMPPQQPTPASFLNVDLELNGVEPLQLLQEHFGERVLVLHCGETESEFHLSVEPLVHGRFSPNLEECLNHFANLGKV